MSSGSQKNAGAELEDMDSLRLPCAKPWGVPPPGVLFTPAAFARYSVSFQQVGVHTCKAFIIVLRAQDHDGLRSCCSLSETLLLPQADQQAWDAQPSVSSLPPMPGKCSW